MSATSPHTRTGDPSMTDTDPIIAEIYVPEGPDVVSVQPVHLSDAPKVEDLLKAMQAAFEVAFTGPSTPKGTNCAESVHEWKMRVRRECEAAIRAIEPEWTP